MNKYEEVIQSIFLSNDGQIDLLTGALAPDQFDQIAKRDLGIADRNSSQTAIISVVLDLQQYLPANYAAELDKIKSEIALLIPVVFLILPVSISFAIWPSLYGLNQAGF